MSPTSRVAGKTGYPVVRMDARLDLRLLGDFRVSIGSVALPREAWRQGRAASLVKLLTLSPRKRLTRDEVIEALWPAVAPEAGATNVRKAVHFARRALGRDDAIRVQSGSIELWPVGTIATDVDRFEAASATLHAPRLSPLTDSSVRYAFQRDSRSRPN